MSLHCVKADEGEGIQFACVVLVKCEKKRVYSYSHTKNRFGINKQTAAHIVEHINKRTYCAWHIHTNFAHNIMYYVMCSLSASWLRFRV